VKKIFSVFFIFLFSSVTTFAFHLIGGELTYECLDAQEGVYLIKLSLYRDCGCDISYDCADFDETVNITIFNGVDSFIRTEQLNLAAKAKIDLNIKDLCLKTLPGFCVERSIGYEKEIALPISAFGYKVVYQRCCRNSSIVNIEEPNNTGITYQTNIPPSINADCNSSPVFKNYPPIVICASSSFEFDHSAIDIDGDSLVYELCSPFSGAGITNPVPERAPFPPYEPVVWVDGFSTTNPLGENPVLNIDANTGQLSGLPTAIGQYLIAICVKEYRNGNLLNTTMRDFQFNAIDVTIEVSDNSITNNWMSLELHPNATNGLISIKQAINHNYKIYSVFGQTVQNGKIPGNGVVDIGAVESGVYFISVEKMVNP